LYSDGITLMRTLEEKTFKLFCAAGEHSTMNTSELRETFAMLEREDDNVLVDLIGTVTPLEWSILQAAQSCLEECGETVLSFDEFCKFVQCSHHSLTGQLALLRILKDARELIKVSTKTEQIQLEIAAAHEAFARSNCTVLWNAFKADTALEMCKLEMQNGLGHLRSATVPSYLGPALASVIDACENVLPSDEEGIRFDGFLQAICGPDPDSRVMRVSVTMEACKGLFVEQQVTRKLEIDRAISNLENELEQAKRLNDKAAINASSKALQENMSQRASLISLVQTAQMNHQMAEMTGGGVPETTEEEEAEGSEEEEEEEEEEEAEEETNEAEEAEIDASTGDTPNPFGDLGAQMKIMVSQLQICSSFSSSITIEWPQLFVDLSREAQAVNLDIVGMFGIGCAVPMPYYNQLVLHIAGPFFLVALIWARAYATYILKPNCTWAEADNQRARDEQLLYFTIYPICSQMVLRAFKCRNILGTYYLVADLEEECYTQKWMNNAIIALVGIALYPIGILAYSYVRLVRNQHKLWAVRKMKDRYGLLFARYEPEFFYWELTEMARKLALTSLVIYVKSGTLLQVLTAMGIAIIFLLMHFKYQPFLEDADDNLQTVSLLSSVLTLWGAALLMGKDPEEPELVGLFMMCINVFVILLVVYGFVVDTGPAMIQSYYQQYLDVKEAARVAENELAKMQNKSDAAAERKTPSHGKVMDTSSVVVGIQSKYDQQICATNQNQKKEPKKHNAQDEAGEDDAHFAASKRAAFLAERDAEESMAANNSAHEVHLDIIQQLFPRYDLDASGTLNSEEELFMLTMNTVHQAKLDIRVEEMEAAIAKKAKLIAAQPMTTEKFTEWFSHNIAKTKRT